MPAWYYFCRPRSMSFHNLTNPLTPPYDLRPLLGLGHRFIPMPPISNGPRELISPHNKTATLRLLERSIRIRCFFADQPPADPHAANTQEYNPRMYIPSDWIPPVYTYPRIVNERMHHFAGAILNEYQPKRGRSNLLPYQRRALQWAQTQDDFVICLTDKNLGFCIMEKTQYIRRVRELLSDEDSYTRLEEDDARHTAAAVETDLRIWYRNFKHSLTREEKKFLTRHLNQVTDPFATFYILLKIHKTPIAQRAVVSYSCPALCLSGLV